MPIGKKNFNLKDRLDNFKSTKNVNIKYKPKTFLRASDAVRSELNLGIGYETSCKISLIGKSDSGKTTEAITVARNAILDGTAVPVYIDLENKFKWGRAREMGFPFIIEKTDLDTGEVVTEEDDGFNEFNPENLGISYTGDFIYVDKNFFIQEYGGYDVESIMSFIKDIFDWQVKEQNKGNIINGAFFIDSYIHMKNKMYLKAATDAKGNYVSSDKSKTNNMSDTQYVNNILLHTLSNYIEPTKTTKYEFTNTLFEIVGVYEDNSGMIPTFKPYGGGKRKNMSHFEIYLGGKAGHPSKSVYITYAGKDYKIGSLVNIEALKAHMETIDVTKDIQEFKTVGKGKIINTALGSILNTKESIEKFKKENKSLFGEIPDDAEFEIKEVEDEGTDDKKSKKSKK